VKKPITKPKFDFIAWLQRWTKTLDKQEQKYTNQLIEAFKKNYQQVQPYIRNIELLIEANPKITQAAIKKSPEFKKLIKATEKELNSFTEYAKTTLALAIDAGALLALSAIKNMGMTPVPPTALEVVTRFLQPDTALYERIGLWAGNARKGVIDAIIEGVGLGHNPRKIAADIVKAYGVELTDALRTSRTAQLWAYRESTRMNYIANGVKKWVWYAELDDRCCGACTALHGQVFDTDDAILDGHYNCRCTMVPVEAYDMMVADGLTLSGKDYFDNLTEQEQNDFIGRAKAEAYRAGRFEFSALAQQVEDRTYGHMHIETPLKDLI